MLTTTFEISKRVSEKFGDSTCIFVWVDKMNCKHPYTVVLDNIEQHEKIICNAYTVFDLTKMLPKQYQSKYGFLDLKRQFEKARIAFLPRNPDKCAELLLHLTN
jgi:hypothetical protein